MITTNIHNNVIDYLFGTYISCHIVGFWIKRKQEESKTTSWTLVERNNLKGVSLVQFK